MKAPLSWLKEFVDIDIDVNALIDKLLNIGFEVEECAYLGKDIKNVVTGKICEISRHPNADKLVVCKVDIGTEKVQIVTGANNVFEGAIVPVAKDGAVLPCGKVIKAGELRGVSSQGMLCSGVELCITDDNYLGAEVDGILILEKSTKIGQDIIEVIGLDDYVLDISVTANRPDCQSILGLAREIAAIMGKTVKEPDCSYITDKTKNIKNYVQVSVKDSELCPTYLMTAVSDVKIEPSPIWMRRRLSAVGLRGISNMVDITNYVLFELGQPMHAFDASSVSNKSIIVRRANVSEKIVPFDEKQYTLESDILVIADSSRAVGLAGIMGGKNSGISNKTKEVLFECAKFKKESIRRSSKKLGLRSDSSARFEKGVESYTTFLAIGRAMHLVNMLNCGKVVDGMEKYNLENTASKTFKMSFNDIENLLGIVVPEKNVISILTGLGIKASINKEVLSIEVPAFRSDIEMPCDVIEEIIRFYGYDKIKGTFLSKVSVTKGGKTAEESKADIIKDTLTALGLSESKTYSFIDPIGYDKLLVDKNSSLRKSVRLLNPLSEELSVMRTTLEVSMLNVLAMNQSRFNNGAKLFELSKVYIPNKLPLVDLPNEKNMLCIGVYGENTDFYFMKEIINSILTKFGAMFTVEKALTSHLHPGISANILANGKKVGYFGQVHPLVQDRFGLTKTSFLAYIDLSDFFAVQFNEINCKQIAKFPAVDRDLSVITSEEVLVGNLLNLVQSCSQLIEDVKLFDIYRGGQIPEKMKSISFSIKIRSTEKTLTDIEIDKIIQKILHELSTNFNAKLR